MNERNLKITFYKPGGNASKNSLGSRMSIPISWLKEMGISPDERNVIAIFDGEKIIIKKGDNN